MLGREAAEVEKKVLIVVVSLIVAFAVGSLFGFGYYQFTRGPAIVRATPLEPSPPTESLPSQLEATENKNLPDTNNHVSELPVSEQSPEPVLPPTEPVAEEQTVVQAQDEQQENQIKEEKVAYITIDDGPHPQNTPAILAILEEFDVKATFFVLGTEVEKYPELIEQIRQAGHAIGNHTYNHIYHETYASDDSFWNSVQKTEEVLLELTGEKPILIREPGGRFRTDPEKQQMVRDKGYGLIHWNIDSYDSRHPIPDAETIFNNVKRQAQKEHLWPAMVLLFHETGGHQSTVEALPLVIQYLKDKGFSFKTLAEMEMEAMANLPKP